MKPTDQPTAAAVPSESEKLARLLALQEAARCAALLQFATGYDEPTRKQKLAAHMAVIGCAWRDALDEMNRCSRETDGKKSADPWWDQLHWQALLAITWVQDHAGSAASRRIWTEAAMATAIRKGDEPPSALL